MGKRVEIAILILFLSLGWAGYEFLFWFVYKNEKRNVWIDDI
jgi:hypothetical protein